MTVIDETRRAGGYPLHTEAIEAGDFRELLLDLLNIRFLVEGIDERPLVVTTIGEEETDEYRERRLLFEDPFVGTFEALLLTPKTGGPGLESSPCTVTTIVPRSSVIFTTEPHSRRTDTPS